MNATQTPVERLRTAARLLLKRNGGPIEPEDTVDGLRYVMVREDDFKAVEAGLAATETDLEVVLMRCVVCPRPARVGSNYCQPCWDAITRRRSTRERLNLWLILWLILGLALCGASAVVAAVVLYYLGAAILALVLLAGGL